jgi:hypothetical protein
VSRGGSRDGWRERGFSEPRRSSGVGPPRSGRPTFARSGSATGFRGPHGHAIGPRGFGPSGTAHGRQGGVSGHGGFSHPALSGGSPTGRSGGRGR